MKTIFTFLIALNLCLVLVSAASVANDQDCSADAEVCVRGVFGQCRTFRNICLVKQANLNRYYPYRPTFAAACKGIPKNTITGCSA